jgi:hypothetical protein
MFHYNETNPADEPKALEVKLKYNMLYIISSIPNIICKQIREQNEFLI